MTRPEVRLPLQYKPLSSSVEFRPTQCACPSHKLFPRLTRCACLSTSRIRCACLSTSQMRCACLATSNMSCVSFFSRISGAGFFFQQERRDALTFPATCCFSGCFITQACPPDQIPFHPDCSSFVREASCLQRLRYIFRASRSRHQAHLFVGPLARHTSRSAPLLPSNSTLIFGKP